jgi:Do/DeqQ family serine protease
VVGSDAPSDLALLKIEAAGLPSVVLGDSNAVQVGDVVLAVGNPLGIGQTVTMGIVSAKGRSTGLGDGSYEDFLQTDAPINQGNSGGALVNTRGELIGINSQILSPSGGNIGIGFAIPANMARHVMTVLRTEGHVRRGQLGVAVQTVTSDLADALGLKDVQGAVVSSVESGSAADRAGVKQGDVITSFDGRAMSDANALINRVADTSPGSRVQIVVVRNGVEHHLTAELGEVKATAAREATAPIEHDRETALGVSVTPLTPELASEAGVSPDFRGLLVEDVRAASLAADAGLQPGDVIQEVNRRPVTTVDQLRSAVTRPSHDPMLLLVNRSERSGALVRCITPFGTVKPCCGESSTRRPSSSMTNLPSTT